MNLDNFNDLPNWDEFDDDDENDGEAWKPNPTKEACQLMYSKWSEIVSMLRGALNNEVEKEMEEDDIVSMSSSIIPIIISDAFEVSAKIRSSEAADMYILRMENAAIIRKNAQFIKISLLGLMADDVLEEQYCTIIRNEIDEFRQLFINWVNTFERDEFQDEWGLFV